MVEECTLRLEEPVDSLLPELADRHVLVDGRGPLDGPTVPATRPITVHDVLTFRLGWGMDFSAGWPQPLITAMGELGLGSGPPEPQVPPEPDEWMRRVSTLPLLYQPGERWLYNTGSDVLGVLVSRAAGQLLDHLPDVGLHIAVEATAGKLRLPGRSLDGHRGGAVLHQITGWNHELQAQVGMNEAATLNYALRRIVVDHHPIELRKECIAIANAAANAAILSRYL